jgi:hypothetical protein
MISPGVARVGAAQPQCQHPASQAVAPVAHSSVVSPLAEYDVGGSECSGSEDSDAPFARADAAAAAAAASGGSPNSPSTDAVPSAEGAAADEEEGDESDPSDQEEDEEGEIEGSYSDVDGDSDPEDSAIRCVGRVLSFVIYLQRLQR